VTAPRRTHWRALLCPVWLVWASLLISLTGCDQGVSSEASPSETPGLKPAPADDATPAIIDAEWVASKLQAPPPPDPKDWLREIEKDPIAALKQMDPAALQARQHRAGSDSSTPPVETIRGKNNPKYEPTQPLRGWPPVVGQFYPNLVLRDQTGQATAISDFRGKVVLVEVVGLTCRACHAFAGANEPDVGHFRGIEPQSGLGSIERYARGYAKLSLDHPDIIFVQLVLYGMDGRGPASEDDVRAWARHFRMDRDQNKVVLIGDQRFISPETRKLIPGFHLIDQNGILRAMSSNDPRHDGLHESLLPQLASLVKGAR
jgi:hypothetical protein